MSVNKINGFKSPFRSKTLRDEMNSVFYQNGVIAIDGSIVNEGGYTIIPPLSFVQLGMIVNKSESTRITTPSILPPYFAIVHSPSSINGDDLVFTFAKSPNDIDEDDVIVGSYDGNEWIDAPKISIDGIMQDSKRTKLDLMQVGPQLGLMTDVLGQNYRNNKGVIIDNTGETIRLDENFLTPVIPQDPANTFNRVDRLVYRRPLDHKNRIGTRKVIIGGTYSTGDKKIHDLQITDGGEKTSSVQCAISSTNEAHVVFTKGYGKMSLFFQRYSESKNSIVQAPKLIDETSSSNFSICVDKYNYTHIVYIKDGSVQHTIVNQSGDITFGPRVVEQYATKSTFAKAFIQEGVIYIVFANEVSPANAKLFMTTRAIGGAQITSPVMIADTDFNIVDACLSVTDDNIVYVAYEDFGNIYAGACNVIGSMLTPFRVISNDVPSTYNGLLSGSASKPKICITDNKKMVIAFLQKKTPTLTGISFFEDGKASMPSILTQNENYNGFDLYVDDFNNSIHLLVSHAKVEYLLLKDGNLALREELLLSSSPSLSMARDKTGSLFHTYCLPYSNSFSPVGNEEGISDIGPLAEGGSINAIVLDSNEFSIRGWTREPMVSERCVITESLHANGTYNVIGVRIESVDNIKDTVVVKVHTDLPQTEISSPGKVQFHAPMGNQARSVKTVSASSEQEQLKTDCPSSDVLLSRILNGLILNYIPSSGPGVNSDLFGMYGDIDVDWSGTNPDCLSMSSGLKVVDLVKNLTYNVGGGVFPMPREDDVMYVIFNGVDLEPVPQIGRIEVLPWNLPIQVLGYRRDGRFHPHLFSVAGMGELDVGESIILGQELSRQLRVRLGITSDATFQPYGSARVISANDPYPTAISKLDETLDTILRDKARQERIISTVDDQDVFTLSTFEFNEDNAIVDITVMMNGQFLDQDRDGGNDYDYKKISSKAIQLNKKVRAGTKIIIRDERTGGGQTANGQVDLSNINQDIAPISNAMFSLGTEQKAWKYLFLKDELGSKVYKQKIINGVFTPGDSTSIQTLSSIYIPMLAKNAQPGSVFLDMANGNQLSFKSMSGIVSALSASASSNMRLKRSVGASVFSRGKALSKLPNGKVTPTDTDGIGTQKMCAIALEDCSYDGQPINVLLFGDNIEGILKGKGFAPGDRIFIDENGDYVNNLSSQTNDDDAYIEVGMADCKGGDTASSVVEDLILSVKTMPLML